MKKKFLILSALTVTLFSLPCGFLLNANAKENITPTVSIDKFNLVFEDNVYLKYAVKFDGINDEDINSNIIGMLYFTEAQEEYTEGNESFSSSVVGHTTIDEVKYYTFEYRNLSAKQMTDYVYSVAYIDIEEERYYSEPVKYSVLDYAYAMLNNEDTTSITQAFKDMLSSMLVYGANAQKYFDYSTDRLADAEYFSVEVVGGTFEDGFTKGLYHAGESATLTAPETSGELVFASWVNSAGETVSKENPFTIDNFTANEIYTATYREFYSEGLSFTLNGSDTCYVSGIGSCTDTDIVIPATTPSGKKVIAIGDSAFSGCQSIESVTIPDSVTSVGNMAFSNCRKLTKIEVDENNEYYKAIDGNLYSKDGKTFVQYAIGKTDASFVIPNGVTSVGNAVFYNCNSLTSVSIPDSVTSIGERAFMHCSNLERVVIPSGVTAISDRTFSGCQKLASITIGANVASIGLQAFYNCGSLTSIEIPDSVTLIGESAFYDCDNLTSIVLSKNVTSIGSAAFFNCTSLANIYYKGTLSDLLGVSIDNYNTSFTNAVMYYYSETEPTTSGSFWHYVDGVITIWQASLAFTSNGNGTCYVSGIGNYMDTDIVIPSVSLDGDSVISIGKDAFKDNTTITSVVIPDCVTSIGENAFYGCTSLTSVDLGDGVATIGKYAFRLCSNLASITFGTGLTKIDDSAFYNCGITSVVIPDGVTSIGEAAFFNCQKLTSVAMPDGVTSIGMHAFNNCVSLTSIVIPSSMAWIEQDAFTSCNKLVSIYYKGTVDDWSKIKIESYNTAFTGAARYFYSENEPTVNGYFWHYVSGVATAWPISFSKGLSYTSNGDGTCSVSGIGTCTDTDIIIPTINFKGYTVTSIAADAFKSNATITSIVIPASVTNIGANAFINCKKLANIEVNGNNEYYQSIDGVLYSKDGKTLIQYPIGNEAKSFVIPDGVTSIDANAVRYCTLTDITIGDSVVSIGSFAFGNSSSVTNVVIGKNVTSISNGAFYGCSIVNVYYKGSSSDWSNLTIGSNNDTLPTATRYFYSATEPTSAGYFWHFVDGVVTVWPLSFSEGLEFTSNGDGTCSVKVGTCTDSEIIIPEISSTGDRVTSIGDSAFFGCSNVTSIEMPDSIASIGKSAFRNCSSLTSIVIPDGVSTMQSYTFYGCKSLASIVIPDSVTSIGDSAFYGCTSLTSMVIPNGVSTIQVYTFYGCTGLTNVVFHDNVTSIGQYAFYGCTGLTDLVIPISVTSVGMQAFNGCQNLANVYYKGSTADWDNVTINYDNDKFKNATHYCYSEVEPTTIGKFWHYVDDVITVWPEFIPAERNLTFTSRNNGTCYVSGIGDYVDATEIVIPSKSPAGDTVTSINANVFKGCTALTSIIIPDTVTTISNEAFLGCTALTSIEIPDTVTFIGSSVFQSCTALTSVKLSNQLITISSSLFYSCSALESIEIPDSVTMISASAFRYCKKLSTVKFSNKLTDIEIYAFEGCTTLNSIELPSSLFALASYCFRDCSALTSITIPQNVTSISKNAFENCSALTSVTLPNTLKSIGDSAFKKCSKLTSITIPASVTSIGASAFYQCTGLTTATINGGSIGGSAFYGCNKLKTVVMGNSVTSIGASAFYGCTSLTSVTIGGSVLTIGEAAFQNCSSLKTIVIPAAVTRIEKYAFKGTSLTSATFEDTDNWYRGTSATTNGSKVTVTKTSTNATYLKSSTTAYYWNKT